MTGGADRAAFDRVDRVLAACGGGRVIVVGEDIGATLRAWRRRGVLAEAGTAGTVEDANPVDLLWLDRPCGGLDDDEMVATMTWVRSRSPRALVVVTDAPRDRWESRWLRQGWRKHPLYQQVVDYGALEHEDGALVILEPVPPGVSCGAALDELAAARDLHMDMLRETGRRADAHVARYMWARRFVRPRDRVLDAACGLGYGSRVLADGTLADSVLGLDIDAAAIAYASDHYGAARSRLSFDTRDLASLGDMPASSFDVIVSFETVEHVRDPDRFLADCRRLLTPGGRFVCSVPNEWLDDRGVDPNPHHLHVFDRQRLEALCRRHFALEHTFGQTAGGGMKLPRAGRALWEAESRTDDAEWWLAVGMTSPLGAVADPVATRWQPGPAGRPATLVDFARHYEHPWLVRALVSMGLRTESAALRGQIADLALTAASAGSADRGAALCVRAYAQWEQPEGVSAETHAAIDAYCDTRAGNAHVARWHISLRYVQGLAALDAGDRAGAIRALTACAEADPLRFNPLLATKSVGASWLLGWLAVQARDVEGAGRWWRAGVDHAERALRRPWREMMVDRDRPVLFGLREAALVVDLASQCAAGLHLLHHASDRPGLVASQVADSMAERLARQTRSCDRLEQAASDLQASAAEAWQRCQAAEAEVFRLRRQLAVSAMTPPSPGGDDRRVAIFGTGQGGRQVLAQLRELGVRIECFADNDPSRWDQPVDEVPVVDPASLRARGVGFVAVASAPGRDAIFAQLCALGFREGRDFAAFV